jgi:predicted Mrr-cat superfamily restriction endonuclease
LGDLKSKNKDQIRTRLEDNGDNGYSSSNSTVGIINHFVNNMDIGSLCLIPDPESNDVYLAKVTSDYYFKLEDKGYPHQRKVEFLNKENPFDRIDFSEDLKKAVSPKLTVADVTHRLATLNTFLGIENNDDQDKLIDIEEELRSLFPLAIENIKYFLESSDEEKRLKASINVIKSLQSYNS